MLTHFAVFTGMHVDGNSDLIQVKRVMTFYVGSESLVEKSSNIPLVTVVT